MKVLVCGSRNFYDWRSLEQELKEHDITLIIEGCASGADSLARQWAIYNEIPYEEYPADWSNYGKAAGPLRNQQMLDKGDPELVIAFMSPNSRGTRHMVEIAKKAGIPTKIVLIGENPHK